MKYWFLLKFLTIFLCQQTTCLNVELLFADLLFEPKLQVCPVTARRDTKHQYKANLTPNKQTYVGHKLPVVSLCLQTLKLKSINSNLPNKK